MNTSKSTTKLQYNESFYRGKRILVLGGLGFMGQNLVRKLISLDSVVTVVDLDGNSGRALGIPHARRIYYADRCEKKLIDKEISSNEIIFNLAGRSGVADSFQHPEESLKNCSQHLSVLQVCQKHNPDAIVIFPSSCLVYGKSLIPALESNQIHPSCPYAIHKYTCEMYSRLYRETYGLSTVVLRISNPIGPYQYQVDGSYGVYNQFIYQATKDYDVTVYGKGEYLRDIIGIDDVVRAFLYCASAATVVNTVNVGRGLGIPLCDYAQFVVKVIGSGRVVYIDWPKDTRVATNFVADISSIRDLTGWQPSIDLKNIINTTSRFYRQVNPNVLIGARK